MHDTAMNQAKLCRAHYVNRIDVTVWSPKVADIGAYDLNGSIRSVFSNLDHVGVDLENGPGMDLVLEDPYRFQFEDDFAGFVLASSVFEHADFFWLTFLEMLRIYANREEWPTQMRPQTFFHRYPRNSWRFYPDSSLALQDWARKNNYHVSLLQSLIGPRGTEG